MNALMRIITRVAAVAGVAILLITLLPGCDRLDRVVFSKYFSVNPKGWLSADEVVFDADMAEDSVRINPSSLYDVLISVRHTDAYRYDTLWLSVELESLMDGPLYDTVGIPLTDKYGMWRGEGHRNIYIISDTLMKGVHIPEGWEITLSHAMSGDTVAGVNDVGVLILKHK